MTVVGPYEEFGPFGDFGDDVGQRAIEVLAGLLESVPNSFIQDDKLVIWSEDDSETFESLVEFETGIKFIEPHPDADGGDVGGLHRAFGRFHIALPLSEAERYWLLSPLDEPPRASRVNDLGALIGTAEEITSAGVRQVVQGRELVRRLGMWRREKDEFAHQGTLDEAREALGHIAKMLVIEPNWPDEHRQLLRTCQSP